MPFGLTNSGAINGSHFKRFGVSIRFDLYRRRKSEEDHLVNLEEVFRRLREAYVKLNPKRCSFVKQEVEYLGHVVSPEGIKPNPEKICVVRDSVLFPRI